MKYISAEEFLKQPREVQEVFLDNIVLEHGLEYGDLYKDTADLTVIESLDYINTSEEGTIYHSVKGNMSDYSTIVPLLTEGQLREFIEDKVESKISIIHEDNKFRIYTDSDLFGEYEKEYSEDYSILNALWNMAVETANIVFYEKEKNK